MNLVSTSLQGNLQRSRRCGAQPDAAHILTQAGPRTESEHDRCRLSFSVSHSFFLLLCSAVVWINKSRLDSRLIAACKSSANASAIKTTCFCAFQLVAQSQRRSQSLGWSQLCNRLPTIAVNWPKVSALRHVSIRRSTARSKWAAWVTQPDTRRLGADPLAAVQRLSMLISQ